MKCLQSDEVGAFVNLFPKQMVLATLLFKNEGDVKTFVEMFHKSNKYEIDDLLDFRNYKIDKSSIPLSEFLQKCELDLKSAFEETFIQSFDELFIELVKSLVNDEVITLAYIFEEFHKDIDICVKKRIMSS